MVAKQSGVIQKKILNFSASKSDSSVRVLHILNDTLTRKLLYVGVARQRIIMQSVLDRGLNSLCNHGMRPMGLTLARKINKIVLKG